MEMLQDMMKKEGFDVGMKLVDETNTRRYMALPMKMKRASKAKKASLFVGPNGVSTLSPEQQAKRKKRNQMQRRSRRNNRR